MIENMTQIRRLPLHAVHQKLGAKIGAFGEWEVPLYYEKTGIISEHEAVRAKAGIFDISHMGEIFVEGPKARETLEHLLSNHISKLILGKAIYSPMLNEQGGFVDDVIVYQIGNESYLVIVNASNVAKDYEWMLSHNPYNAAITNRSEEFGLLSIQGPNSLKILKKIFPEPLEILSYYSIAKSSKPWADTWIARTGYTGELGYEILLKNQYLEKAYEMMMDQGKEFGILPIGFGARDTLRLEAKMPLYGQDMNDETTPLEAGLDWAVFFDKSFIGKEALLKQKKVGLPKKLVGFEMIDRGLARHDYAVTKNGKTVGRVTSGSFAPTLKKNIGLAYVETNEAVIGNEIEILIRGTQTKARIVKTPFYKRNQKELV